jgi:hypothetical protein
MLLANLLKLEDDVMESINKIIRENGDLREPKYSLAYANSCPCGGTCSGDCGGTCEYESLKSDCALLF